MSKLVVIPRPRGVPPSFAAPSGSARPAPAANDDTAENPALLRAALRLFADHGLGAARHAYARAEQAFFAADSAGYRWWLAVTRTLDRTLAAELAGRCDRDSQPGA